MTSVGAKADRVWVEGVHLWNDEKSCATSGLRYRYLAQGLCSDRIESPSPSSSTMCSSGVATRKKRHVCSDTPWKKGVVNRASRGQRTTLAEAQVNDNVMGAIASVLALHS